MTIDEYFGDWMKVLDRTETMKVMGWLRTLNQSTLCPSMRNVFRAFELCSYDKCKVVFIGQDLYPQKNVATGILFGNSFSTPENKLSPSLQVIKESVINFEIPHNLITFDPTLESWAKQGILMLNSSLTIEVNKIGVHIMKWRPFMIAFLKQMSLINPGIVYVLFGSQAQVLEPYIGRNNYVIKIEHPAYFARTHKKIPYHIWHDINDKLYKLYGERVEWFKEEIFF